MPTRRQLLASIPPVILLATALPEVSRAGEHDDDDMPLVKLRPVTTGGAINVFEHTFTMSGLVYDFGMQFMFHSGGFAFYDLKRQYRSLNCKLAIDDNFDPGDSPSTYSFKLDGKVLTSGEFRKGRPPLQISLDVTDGRSLGFKLTNGVSLGNPVLSTKPSQDGAGGNKAIAPALSEPQDKAIARNDTLTFRWREVPGADTYALQVILKRRQGNKRQPDTRMWAVTTTSSSFTWDLKDWPSGQYLWSVLAFDNERIIGIFSEEREFTVAR
jgi:hypothetical protein